MVTPCGSHGLRAVARFLGQPVNRQRVVSFIDGLNLYHAILALKRSELHWVDLRALSKIFIRPYSQELIRVIYFSSYAKHVSESKQKSQQTYVKALEIKAVCPILGYFKEKNHKCLSCSFKWVGHEEKETDVNIALHLLDLAYQDAFDRALVISNDSDLAPAIKMVRSRFPNKHITTVAPPRIFHSRELVAVSSDKTKIKVEHLERCLLPLVVSDASGLVSVSRPQEYMPAPVEYPARSLL